MLYDAIKIACVDGYAEKEKAAARKAADLLGIDRSVVTALEGLVLAEEALKQMRADLLASA
jgi:hypothetical protein